MTKYSNTGSPRKLNDQHILLGLRALILLQYGGLVLMGVILPLYSQMVPDRSFGRYADLSFGVVTVLFIVMLSVGLPLMFKALRHIRNPMPVEQCIAFAVVLSIPSSYVYFRIGVRLDMLRLDPVYPLQDEISFCVYLVSMLLGFYMPFVLLTHWVKYSYRQDEF